MSKFDKVAIFALAKWSLKPNAVKKTWAKFGTIGFVRSKCKKSKSFMVIEARFLKKAAKNKILQRVGGSPPQS